MKNSQFAILIACLVAIMANQQSNFYAQLSLSGLALYILYVGYKAND